MSESTIRISGADIVAFEAGEHRLLKNGEIVIQQDSIIYVGKEWSGDADVTLNGRAKLVIPGMISTHAHVDVQEGNRIILDAGRRDAYRTSFTNWVPMTEGGTSFLAKQDAEASIRFGMAQLIRNGVTTVVAYASGGHDNGETFARIAEEMGIRLYFAPAATDGRYMLDRDGRIFRSTDEVEGLRQLEKAVKFIEQARKHGNSRLQGVIVADEFYNGNISFMREARDAARGAGVRWSTHFSDKIMEFQDTVRSTGKTPTMLLAEAGLLGPDLILAHGVLVAGHSRADYPYGDDLAMLAESGVHISHCPVLYARRGWLMESFQRYIDRGINVSLGMDVFPMDMLGEMRMCSLASKIADRNNESAQSIDVFNASNISGAKALGRDDLGRIEAGAKADLVMLNMENLQIGPSVDPIRELVYLATPQLIDLVIVDGRILVEHGELTVADEGRIFADAARSSRRIYENFSAYHPHSLTLEEAFPPSLKPFAGTA